MWYLKLKKCFAKSCKIAFQEWPWHVSPAIPNFSGRLYPGTLYVNFSTFIMCVLYLHTFSIRTLYLLTFVIFALYFQTFVILALYLHMIENTFSYFQAMCHVASETYIYIYRFTFSLFIWFFGANFFLIHILIFLKLF